jgi:ribosomal-protein-alanine N-acetyltransferase
MQLVRRAFSLTVPSIPTRIGDVRVRSTDVEPPRSMHSPTTRGTIRRIQVGDEEQLFALFRAFAADERIARYFHPHPFDRVTASRITRYSGSDVYFGFFWQEELVGYAMLRGWDEGYEVPSFGVAVAPGHSGLGVGGELLQTCIKEARARGARKMMLKVHIANRRARRWYLSSGFREIGTADDGQLVLELELASI